jgi:hypothetical protein
VDCQKVDFDMVRKYTNERRIRTVNRSFFSEPSGGLSPEPRGIVALSLLAKKFWKNPSWAATGLDFRGCVARTLLLLPLIPPKVALGVPNRSADRLFPAPTAEIGVPSLYLLPETVRTVAFSFKPFLFFNGLVKTLSPLPAMTPFIRPSGKSFQELITASPFPLFEGNVETNKQVV